MKKINIYIGLLALIALCSCKNDPITYDGEAMLNFQSNAQKIVVIPNTTEYEIIVGLLRPATQDVTFSIDELENTDPSGQRFSVATDLSNMRIAKGETIAKIIINANVGNYNGEMDQLKLKIASASVPITLADSIVVTIQPFCPAAVADFVGDYEWDNGDGTTDPTVAYTITYVAGDTLLLTMTSPVQAFLGNDWSNPQPFKILVTYTTTTKQTEVVDNQNFATSGTYGLCRIRNVNSGGAKLYGTLDYCDGTLTYILSRQVSAGWFGASPVYLKKVN